jgi:hypothetical protein
MEILIKSFIFDNQKVWPVEIIWLFVLKIAGRRWILVAFWGWAKECASQSRKIGA